jgi:hypothetical protein
MDWSNMSAAGNAIILAHFDRPASINASHFKNFTQISMLRLNAKLVLLPVVVLADGRNFRQRPLFHKSQRSVRWHSGHRISLKNACLGALEFRSRQGTRQTAANRQQSYVFSIVNQYALYIGRHGVCYFDRKKFNFNV